MKISVFGREVIHVGDYSVLCLLAFTEARKKKDLRRYKKKLRRNERAQDHCSSACQRSRNLIAPPSSRLIYPDHTREREILIRAIRIVDNYRVLELGYIDDMETAGGDPGIQL